MYLKGLKTNKQTQIVDNLNQTIYPLTPTSDQDRISPYSIITISSRQVRRIKKKILVRELLKIDSIPNSPNKHHKNCKADSKENY